MSLSATYPRSSWMRRTHGITSAESNPGGKRFFHCSNSGMRCFIGRSFSAVALAADHVHRAERGHDVGELIAVQHLVHAAQVNVARRAHVDFPRHSFAGADEIEAELAV